MKRFSLHIRMILGGIIAFFIPFVIGGVITYVKVSGSVENLAREKLIQIAVDMSKVVQLIFMQELKIVSAIAADPVAVEISSSGQYRMIDRKLTAVGDRLGRDYDDFILIDKKGIVRSVSTDKKRIGIVLTDRNYFQKAMRGEANVSEPVVSRATGDLIVVACVPVYDMNRKITGAAAGIIRIDFLIKNLSSVKIGNTGYLFMVNSAGLLIIHPDRTFILKNNMYNYPELKNLREKMLGSCTGSENYVFNGTKKTAGFAPVEITGWSIAVTQNRDEMMAPARSLLNFLIISSVLFFLAVLAAIYFISRRISLPVEKSLEIFNQVVLHSNESVVYIGINRKIWRVNSTLEKLTGYTSLEIIGTEPVFTNTSNTPPDEIWKILNEGGTWSGRINMTAKDGEHLTLETLVLPVMDEKGKIYSFVEIGRDVTKEIISENRLKEAQKLEAIGVLAGGIAHDFNNILAGIFGYAEISLMNLSSPEKVRKNIQEILSASERARDLVNQILAFSRKTESDLRPLMPKYIIKDALKLLRASIPSTIEIHDTLDSDSVIMGDSSQLHQVIVNICMNSAYAINNSNGIIYVVLEDIDVDADFALKHPGLKEGRHILIKISDSGQGMDTRIMAQIFDPFFTTKPPGEGTGLGLSVVHGIVKNFRGAITVYSEIGKGTVFNIIIPVAESEEIEPEKNKEEKIEGGSERIFLLDDEIMIIDSIQTILHSLGYSVTSFTDCRAALDHFRENYKDYDIIITDYTMPYFTGIELTRLMKAIRNDVPVILSSGYINRNLEEAAADAGVALLLKKPVTTRELAVQLRIVLDNKT